MVLHKIYILIIAAGLLWSNQVFSDTAGMEKAKQAIRIKDYRLASELLLGLAEQGNQDAQYQLAIMYKTGRGVEKNILRSSMWLIKGAHQGHVKAQYTLGTFYENGWGIGVSNKDALIWYKKAAQQGHIQAQIKIDKWNLLGSFIHSKSKINLNESLLTAARRGNFAEVKNYINKGANSNFKNQDGRSVLVEAVRSNNVDIVKFLLKNGARDKVSKNSTALLLATERKYIDVVKALLKYKATLNQANKHGYTPIMLATKKNSLPLVKLFIQHKSDVLKKNVSGKNVFDIALNLNRKDIVEYLKSTSLFANVKKSKNTKAFKKIAKKLQTNQKADENLKGWLPLTIATWRGQKDVVKALIAQGQNVNKLDKLGYTPLSRAVLKGNIDIVNILLKAGADTLLGNDDTKAPLIIAAQHGYKEIVNKLLRVKTRNKKQTVLINKAFTTAVQKGYGDIILDILKLGISDEVLNKVDLSKLFLSAVTNNQEELTIFLISQGADVNSVSPRGMSAIMIAAAKSFNSIGEKLIQNGADINTRDKKGKSAVLLAIKSGNVEFINNLIKRNIPINTEDNKQTTSLMVASASGNMKLVKLLLKSSNINVRNLNNLDALAFAIRNRKADIAKLLIDTGSNPYMPMKVVHNITPEMRTMLEQEWTFIGWVKELMKF
jgi:ankyrin repeat protein